MLCILMWLICYLVNKLSFNLNYQPKKKLKKLKLYVIQVKFCDIIVLKEHKTQKKLCLRGEHSDTCCLHLTSA